MRLQLLVLGVLLGAVFATAHPLESDVPTQTQWQTSRRTRSPSFPSSVYSDDSVSTDKPRPEVANGNTRRRSARSRVRAEDNDEVRVQHWPPIDESRENSNSWQESREEKSERYKKENGRSEYQEKRHRDEVDESIAEFSKSGELDIQRRSWGEDTQKKTGEKRRYWHKPILVEEIPDVPVTTESGEEDWSERVASVGLKPVTRTREPPESQSKVAEKRSDWRSRQPTPVNLAQLNRLTSRLTPQFQQEQQQGMMSLEQRQSIQQQEMQQTLQEQRQQQVLQQNLQLHSMQQKLHQQTMQQNHQLAMQQQQASATVAAVVAAAAAAASAANGGGGDGSSGPRGARGPTTPLLPMVEVEVVDEGAENDVDERTVRRLGHPHEQQHVHVVKVAVPQPVPVPVPQPVPVAVPHPVPVRVKVAEHIEVPVVRTVAVPVETPIPVKVEHLIPYPVEKPVPVPVEKPVPYPVHEPYPVKVPVVKTIHHYLKKVKKTKKKKKKEHHHHHKHKDGGRRRHHPLQRRQRHDRRRQQHRRRVRKLRRPRPSD